MSKNNISQEMNKILDEYSDKTAESLNRAIDVCSQIAANQLKTAGTFKNRTGKYRKNWAIKKGNYTAGVLNKVVYSKKRYQLTHLIEYGHVGRDGKRVKAFPHIKRVEANSVKYFTRIIKEKL